MKATIGQLNDYDDDTLIDSMSEYLDGLGDDEEDSNALSVIGLDGYSLDDSPEAIYIADDGDSGIMSLSSDADNAFSIYDLHNVVIISGTFNSEYCFLIVPFDDYDKLSVFNYQLLNVSNSSVTCRLVDTDYPTLLDYDSTIYVLPSMNSSTSSVYSYGNWNYQRHYYLSSAGTSNRITYSDTYGAFYPDEISVNFSSGQRSYYILFFIVFMLGVIFICLRRKR